MSDKFAAKHEYREKCVDMKLVFTCSYVFWYKEQRQLSLPVCFNYSTVISCLNYSYSLRSLRNLFIHWFVLIYTMAFLLMGSLINSDTFSQESTSPKQIIIQNILCSKGFPIHLLTERYENIIQWKKVTIKQEANGLTSLS